MVYRVYVEKQPAFAVEAAGLLEELRGLLGITGLTGLRILNRYDVEGIEPALFESCVATVFSEPPVDIVHRALPAAAHLFAVEYLPGQFDQRADSAAECIQLISQGERPAVQSAKVYLLEGALDVAGLQAVKQYVINPVEAREADLAEKATLKQAYPVPPPVPMLEGFTQLANDRLAAVIQQYALAMDEADLAFCRDYFRSEGRDPSLTELRMLDTYWSDHCRHTTFGTVLAELEIEDDNVRNSYGRYLILRKQLGCTEKPQTLMDIATIGARAIKATGGLENLDESDEINACSVKINVDNNGQNEDWLLLFKNETHNHPTEIEPFGGAATCIGGAIRDPLANRGYVFGAMRVTGAGDPTVPVSSTLPGKLPQRKLCVTAAAGYASYGNQIGLATGEVTEIYHPGYIAKRMEVGAVLGAVPLKSVRRDTPAPGDVVVLLGGATGRDGCGGATGSSKAHGAESLQSCGAEVQKGNAPVERKLQRLFKNPEATLLIRRCNDFGAGGVSVAIGELADGLEIDLDAVPKKYDGLDGTELAISESQERMAVVVEQKDAARFMELAHQENLDATQVAVITAQPRLKMRWRGDIIVDIGRDFINSNGAPKTAAVRVAALKAPALAPPAGQNLQQRFEAMAGDLNRCSQKGLAGRFGSTIGAGSVLMPFGGRHQLSPAGAMVMKLPVAGETTTCAGMAFGFDPFISAQNPWAGAYLAVADSIAKLCARGFAPGDIRLSFQEYFPRLRDAPERWGQPFAALLGALSAQLDFGVAAIGGKDSMSGSFEELDVPPTLISFAVAQGDAPRVTCSHFQLPGSRVVWLRPGYTQGLLPEAASMKAVLAKLWELIGQGKVLSVAAVGAGGLAHTLFNMCVGSRTGVRLDGAVDAQALFAPAFGSFVVELEDAMDAGLPLGVTTGRFTLEGMGEAVDLDRVQTVWENRLEDVFPYRSPSPGGVVRPLAFEMAAEARRAPKIGVAKPKALIPVFPGTNCEDDTARALHRAGAQAEVFVVKNLSPADVAESAAALASKIDQSNIVVLPGGFSGGDEPEGSAKLIAAFFRGPVVSAALARLLRQRDGLMLGICNGFQALVKLGLLPYGEILPTLLPENLPAIAAQRAASAPTLTFNAIGRHQSTLAHTRVASNLSPWLSREAVGSVHTIAACHGEGRFVAEETLLEALAAAGQIATQYVDLTGVPTMDVRYNPNGSAWAVEGICSPDGRVLGKMGHTERVSEDVYKNVPGNKYQRLFEGGVGYFQV